MKYPPRAQTLAENKKPGKSYQREQSEQNLKQNIFQHLQSNALLESMRDAFPPVANEKLRGCIYNVLYIFIGTYGPMNYSTR